MIASRCDCRRQTQERKLAVSSCVCASVRLKLDEQRRCGVGYIVAGTEYQMSVIRQLDSIVPGKLSRRHRRNGKVDARDIGTIIQT
jgi:hypothetical protein